jgi:uncharacterized membrane protein
MSKRLPRLWLRRIALIWFGLGLVGLADSLYLLFERATGSPVRCGPFGGGCNVVATSPYAAIYGVPVALLGALFYGGLAVGALLLYRRPSDRLALAGVALTALGFAASMYFDYLQLFVIVAYCIYCQLSMIVSVSAFALGLAVWRERGRGEA